MGIGSGVAMFAAGAVLTWAVEIDLPYISDDTLGLILMLAGVIAAVAAGLAASRYPQTGYGTGIMLTAVGAIVIWAVDVDVPYLADSAFGLILLLAGTVAISFSAIANARQPQTGLSVGVVLVIAGAVLAWAADVTLPYVADYTWGAILLVAGLAAIAASGVALHRKSRHATAQYSQYPSYPPRY
ncbi:MAG TPA: hypothetical protein VEX15_23820 [Nocardioidaceae bacterium]|nr:hypothetical protein [Nocardioidaceae bacterium]